MRWISAAVVALAMTTAGSLASAEEDRRVAHEASFPPFSSQTEADGTYTGFEMTSAPRFTRKRAGLKCEWIKQTSTA